MTTMRAKMQVLSVTTNGPQCEQLRFCGVSRSGGYPADGSDEDNTFAKFSPSIDLSITIMNPDLIGTFAVGDRFYVDFSPAPK